MARSSRGVHPHRATCALLCLLLLTAALLGHEGRVYAQAEEGENLNLALALRLYEALEYDRCLQNLLEARRQQWNSHAQVVTILRYEGMVRAILGQEDEARAAFRQLVYIAPGEGLPPNLSPKITRVFEQVRNDMRGQPELVMYHDPPMVVAADVPISVEADFRDPEGLVEMATLHFRERGDTRWDTRVLDDDGEYLTRLDPPQPRGSEAPAIEYFVRGHDAFGGVLAWTGTPDEPLVVEFPLSAPAPDRAPPGLTPLTPVARPSAGGRKKGFFARHAFSIATLGAGLAAAGTGTWMGVEAGDIDSRAKDSDGNGALDITRSEAQQGERYALGANVLFGVAGAAAITATLLFLLYEDGEEE